MSESGLKVVIIGASGATGKPTLSYLLKSERVDKVISFGRKALTEIKTSDASSSTSADELKSAETSGKLVQHVVDFSEENPYGDKMENPNVAISCLGTTRKDAGSEETFKEIDLGIPTKFSIKAKEAGAQRFSLLSASIANINSWFLYPKTKGQCEKHVTDLQFQRLDILQPGLLDRGAHSRGVEKVGAFFMTAIKVENVALALVKSIFDPLQDVVTVRKFGNKEMNNIAKDKN
eukprot:CFRG6214T1